MAARTCVTYETSLHLLRVRFFPTWQRIPGNRSATNCACRKVRLSSSSPLNLERKLNLYKLYIRTFSTNKLVSYNSFDRLLLIKNKYTIKVSLNENLPREVHRSIGKQREGCNSGAYSLRLRFPIKERLVWRDLYFWPIH